MPAKISASRKYRGASGKVAERAPHLFQPFEKLDDRWNPTPITKLPHEIHDIFVCSTLRRVRSQRKWVSAVTLNLNLRADASVIGSAIPSASCAGSFR
jgi:hypothetical protein